MANENIMEILGAMGRQSKSQQRPGERQDMPFLQALSTSLEAKKQENVQKNKMIWSVIENGMAEINDEGKQLISSGNVKELIADPGKYLMPSQRQEREPVSEITRKRESRLQLREDRLEKQRMHREGIAEKKGDRDLFRTSLALVSALRREYKVNPAEETELQSQDAVDEMIRYAKKAGINIQTYITELYREDPSFWDKILKRQGKEKKRLVPAKPPKGISKSYTPEQEKLISDNMEEYNKGREEVIQALKGRKLLP